MSMDDRPSPQGIEALRRRFEEHSRKAQAYYTVMHQAREITGNDAAASAWMDEPLSAFDGKTPSELVNGGRVDDVLHYIGTLKSGPAS